MSETKANILKSFRAGLSVLNFYARKVHTGSDPETWKSRYNKGLHKIVGMQEMAEIFGYKTVMDFDETQGFYARVTAIRIGGSDGFLTAYPVEVTKDEN